MQVVYGAGVAMLIMLVRVHFVWMAHTMGVVSQCITENFLKLESLPTFFQISIFLFSIQYLAIDTQWIMGSRYTDITEEDYVFAVLKLYLDFVMIFLHLLAMLKQ